MDDVGIPYDRKRKEDSFWYNHSEDYIHSINELVDLVDTIRLDRDDQRPKPGDDEDDITVLNFKLPLWQLREFPYVEIRMYKKRFDTFSVPIPSSDVNFTVQVLTGLQLRLLFESLGQTVSSEDASELIDEHDLARLGGISFEEFLTLLFRLQHGKSGVDSLRIEQVVAEARAQQRVLDEIETVMRTSRAARRSVKISNSNTNIVIDSDSNVINNPIIESETSDSFDPANSLLANVSVLKYGGCPLSCDLIIRGPMGTVYEGGQFRVTVTFEDGYPFVPPTCQLRTRILSVNVLQAVNGDGVLPHLQHIWKSTMCLSDLAEHILHLLTTPAIELVPGNILQIIEAMIDLHNDSLSALEMRDKAAEKEEEEDDFDVEDRKEREQRDELRRTALQNHSDSMEELRARKQNIAIQLENLNRVELFHFNTCRQFVFEKDVFEIAARQFVNRFALHADHMK